ncbi:hypothetical protein XI25_14170 [Paenibacillus sp. DMB20]|nr:hypothetical protein XI25_14170 [Paenibacillus sp. DMB20]
MDNSNLQVSGQAETTPLSFYKDEGIFHDPYFCAKAGCIRNRPFHLSDHAAIAIKTHITAM